MPMANPRRGPDEEAIRIQEHTGGFRPREMVGDYDVNPNEDSDGLSHLNRHAASTEERREQLDPAARKKRALREMEGELPHITLNPEEMGEVLNRTPAMEQESELLESAMGVDMGHASDGIGISQGANTGPVRREGPGLIFSRSRDAFDDAWSLIKDRDDDVKRFMEREAEQIAIRELQNMNDEKPGFIVQPFVGANVERNGDRWSATADASAFTADGMRAYQREHGKGSVPPREVMEEATMGSPDRSSLKPMVVVPSHDVVQARGLAFPPGDERHDPNPESLHNALHPSVGEFGWDKDISDNWQETNKSTPPTIFLSDIVKGKRKKRGRKYEEDEESEADEKKTKAKRKRKRKRTMKRGKKEASRDIKGKTTRRAGNVEQNISRSPKEQAFSPRRMLGSNPRASGIPLRIRDPVAYQRKLASEKFRRQMGSLPRGQSAHADTRGITGEKVQTIGTKMPSRNAAMMAGAPKGTSLSQFKPNRSAARDAALAGEPLGGDPLTVKMDISKRATLQMSGKDIKGLKRVELLEMKRDLKRLLQAVEKLTKSTPELGDNAKRGATAGGASDPGTDGVCELNEEEKARWRFIDQTPYEQVHGVMKR